MSDHPFATYLRVLGKGPKSRRSLTMEEAEQAIAMILAGEVTDKQLGAFLLLMRANGESEQELMGFVTGIRKFYQLHHNAVDADLDISAYAGKWRYPPYFLLSIKLLNQQGYRILLHGDSGQFQDRHYAHSFMQPLGFREASSTFEADTLLQQGELVYLPLQNFAPQLKEILHLKSELGVRTVFNTAVKLLNPLGAAVAMQGIYHKGVERLHHAASSVNGAQRNLVFKGEGGEPEIRPDALNRLYLSSKLETELTEMDFKSVTARSLRPKNWVPEQLTALWQAQTEDIYGEQAVIATAACALVAMEDLSIAEALSKANQFWQQRRPLC